MLARREIALLAVLAALPLLLFSDTVFLGRVFFERDIQLWWSAQAEVFVRSVLAGSWPVWDPHTAFGQPLLANPNAQVLYPFTWLNLLLRPPTFYTVYVVAHSAFGALGLYRLARRQGLSEPGSATAAAVWTSSGPLLSLVNLWNHFAGAAWIPWVLLAAEKASNPGGALLFGCAVALQLLAGSPDLSLMTVLVAAVFLVARLDRGRLSASLRALLPGLALSVVVALGLSAGQWLPALDVARRGARPTLTAGVQAGWSVHPIGLVQALLPFAPSELPLAEGARFVFDGGYPLLRSLYLGVPALALVAAAFTRRERGPRNRFAFLGLCALVLALGRHAPLHGLLVFLVPGFAWLRYPSKAMVFVALFWALLAGLGLDAWASGDGRPRPRSLLWARAPLLLACLALAAGLWALRDGVALAGALAPELPADAVSASLAPAARAVAVALLLGALALLAGPRRAPLVALLAVADLVAAGHGLNRTAPRSFYAYRPPILDAVRQDDHSRLLVYRYSMAPGATHAGLKSANPYRIAAYPVELSLEAGRALAARLYVLPPVGATWGLDGSYDPDLLGLAPPALTRLVEAVSKAEGTPEHLRLLRLGAVRYVSALHETGLEALKPIATYQSLLENPIRLFEVPDPLPRCYAVGTSRAAEDPEALRLLVDPGFDPAREIVTSEAARASPAFTARTRLVELRPDRVRIEAELSEPGYVVLVDAYDPGWKATVDGAPAPVLRANVGFRAVAVPAGKRVVEFRYRPTPVLLGLALSAVTLLGVLAGLAYEASSGGLPWRSP